MTVRILQGDCRDVLRTLEPESVHCIVTSPPYFGLRDYGVPGQIGLEQTPGEYVSELVAVFRESRRVLRQDGTLWLNIGDSYVTSPPGRGPQPGVSGLAGINSAKYQATLAAGHGKHKGTLGALKDGLKQKDLIGIPWQVAFALRDDGWYLRSDIIWHKPNPMPESVTDRPTSAHEHIFLLTKSPRYFFDAEAVREIGSETSHGGAPTNAGPKMQPVRGDAGTLGVPARKRDKQRGHGRRHAGFNDRWDAMPKEEQQALGRNIRNVWTVATQPYSEAHFATFPPALIEPCIKAGTSEKGCCPTCGEPWVRAIKQGGLRPPASRPDAVQCQGNSEDTRHQKGAAKACWSRERATTGWEPSCACPAHKTIPCTVLDPFGGAGTTGVLADRLQRNAVIIELNPEYAEMARARLSKDRGALLDYIAETAA